MAFSVNEALEYLRNAHRHRRVPHSLLFSGEEGSGKRRLIAEFFAVANGEPFSRQHPDFHGIEPESKSRRILVEQVRELESALRMRAAHAPWKFGVISDADRLMPQAANAFLKTLEEPPANSVLILSTALPDALLDTVRSRCVHVPLRRLEAPVLEAGTAALIDEVARRLAREEPSVAMSLSLARRFQEKLAQLRERVEEEHEKELKGEQETYAKTTDGRWLESEEARLNTLTESRYAKGRAALLFRMVELFGDALRCAFTDSPGSLPQYAEATCAIARRFPPAELLRRMRALERVGDHLARNVQEALAIEIGFLRAFGPLTTVELPERQAAGAR